nr:hypothetical protein [Tanacetum cinerariifolium]
MTSLADKAILSGTDNRPPMLEKDMYDSWKTRMKLYMLNKQHGMMILESVKQGPLLWPTVEEDGVTRLKKYSKLSAAEAIQADCDVKATNIILQGLPLEVYALVSTHKVAKELWERIQMLMQGTSLTKQERECKLYDEFDKFTYRKGETLHDFYLRFSLLLNDMNISTCLGFTTSAAQANSSNMSISYPMNDISSTVNQNAFMASSSAPPIDYAPIAQNPSEFSSPKTGLVVLVFQKGDDPIDAINHMMSFLTAVVTSRELALEKQVKELNNIVFKKSQSAQTVHMLTKPQVFYTHSTQQALGFQNPCYLKKAQQLKPKLYDGCVIEKSNAVVIPDTKETLMLAEKSRLKMIEKQNDPQMTEKKIELAAKQAFWSQYSVQTDEPNLSTTTTIVEVLKELPKVSMVNSCLKKLKSHFASFDMVVKERTTVTTITEGTCGFEHTKACFRDDIIPFVNALKELFTSFDQCLIDEVTEVQNVFKQMELAVVQHQFFEINELKAQAQAKDTVILQLKEKLHSLKGDVTERNVKREVAKIETLNIKLDHKVDVAPLVPKLRKNRTAHTDYIRHTQDEAATLREIVESERLLSPLNTSLNYACKFTRRIQELLIILQQTCPSLTELGTKLVAVTPKNKTKQIRPTEQITKSGKTTVTTPPSANLDSNTPVLSSTGVILVSSASGSMS